MHLTHQDSSSEAFNAAGAAASGSSLGESSVSPGSSHGSSPVVSSRSLSGASPESSDPAPMIPRHSSLTALSNPSAASAATAARHVRSSTGSPKTIFRYVIQPGQAPPGSISQIERNGQEASSTAGSAMKSIGEGAVVQEKERPEKALLKEGGGSAWAPVKAPAEGAEAQATLRSEPVPQGAAVRASEGPAGKTFTPGGAAKGAPAVAAVQAARRPEPVPQGAAVSAFAEGAAEGAAVGGVTSNFRAASRRASLGEL
ncbi:unnamed protein product [Closterium sp. Naga37s-1]|nr:unnamed protein product [Closterium sp. Naga37s-1]